MAHSITTGCIGCGACKRICPVEAISGEQKALHVIDPVPCIDCGSCGRVCPKNAVRDNAGALVFRLKKTQWLRPQILEDKCYACENCVAVCPANALAMKGEDLPLEENTALLVKPESCVSCGWCFDHCQFGAITMSSMEPQHA